MARTPPVNMSLMASTSEVSRVTSRPTGVRVEEPHVHALHVAEDVAAQIEHHLLPGPLHQVGLDEFEEIGRDQQRQVDPGQLRNALPGIGGEMPRQPCARAEAVQHARCAAPLSAPPGKYRSMPSITRNGPATSLIDFSVTASEEMAPAPSRAAHNAPSRRISRES